MNLNALEIELTRQAIFFFCIYVICLAIGFWITYLMIKAAVREGIRESGLLDRWQHSIRKSNAQSDTSVHLPDMRAD